MIPSLGIKWCFPSIVVSLPGRARRDEPLSTCAPPVHPVAVRYRKQQPNAATPLRNLSNFGLDSIAFSRRIGVVPHEVAGRSKYIHWLAGIIRYFFVLTREVLIIVARIVSAVRVIARLVSENSCADFTTMLFVSARCRVLVSAARAHDLAGVFAILLKRRPAHFASGSAHGFVHRRTYFANEPEKPSLAEAKRIRKVDRIPARIPIQIQPTRQPNRVRLRALTRLKSYERALRVATSIRQVARAA